MTENKCQMKKEKNSYIKYNEALRIAYIYQAYMCMGFNVLLYNKPSDEYKEQYNRYCKITKLCKSIVIKNIVKTKGCNEEIWNTFKNLETIFVSIENDDNKTLNNNKELLDFIQNKQIEDIRQKASKTPNNFESKFFLHFQKLLNLFKTALTP